MNRHHRRGEHQHQRQQQGHQPDHQAGAVGERVQIVFDRGWVEVAQQRLEHEPFVQRISDPTDQYDGTDRVAGGFQAVQQHRAANCLHGAGLLEIGRGCVTRGREDHRLCPAGRRLGSRVRPALPKV
ncbi:hypothetical protein G6F46_014244 [Rhizopus delemar]|nr:hypothetical protein G6F68_010765 [Rhizopus microsporus]KAG1597821.1 hypothetical protein G6F46_014244 [Rhizopus delemar]